MVFGTIKERGKFRVSKHLCTRCWEDFGRLGLISPFNIPIYSCICTGRNRLEIRAPRAKTRQYHRDCFHWHPAKYTCIHYDDIFISIDSRNLSQIDVINILLLRFKLFQTFPGVQELFSIKLVCK